MVVIETILEINFFPAFLHTEGSWTDPTIECALPVHAGPQGAQTAQCTVLELFKLHMTGCWWFWRPCYHCGRDRGG